MKALVTGASGFVGRHLVRALLERGWRVAPLAVDLRRLEPRHLRGVRPDAVFHLAAISHVPTCQGDPALAFAVNVAGTQRLFRALPRVRTIHVSTGDVYGRTRVSPITEDTPPRPLNAYSASKLCAESVALAGGAVVLRPFNHTGPGQAHGFVVTDFASQIARAEAGLVSPVIRVGNLSPVRDFLDVRDVVRAYLLAIDRARPGIPYNIASERGVPIFDLLDRLLGMARVKLRVSSEGRRRRHNEDNVRVGSARRFREATGWRPEIRLDRTLADVLEHERQSVVQYAR